jgi:hypothetical protein
MSIPTSRLSYVDCDELLDKALADPPGIRIKVPDKGKAIHLRMRLHKARALIHEENRMTYSPGDVMYGKSSYDGLVVRIKRDREDGYWVHIEHLGAEIGRIESLANLVEDEEPEAEVVPIPSVRRV